MSGKKKKKGTTHTSPPVEETRVNEKKTRKNKSVSSGGKNVLLKRMKWAVFLLPFILYGNTLSNKYSMDDDLVTTETNATTPRGFSAIPEILTSLYSENEAQGFEYRPVVLISFAVENQIFGVNPVAGHFIQLLLYAALCLLLFKTCQRVFNSAGIWFSFIVTLLFLLHPLHTEVVASLKNRDEILAFIFVLLSLNAVLSHGVTGKWKYLVFAALYFLCAFYSKRSSMPYAFLIPLIAWFTFSEKHGAGEYKKDLKRLWIFAYGFIIVLFVFSVHRYMNWNYLHQYAFKREVFAFENPLYLHQTGFVSKLGVAGYTMAYYFKLLLVPHPLVCYYGFSHIDVKGWSGFMSIAGFLVTGVFSVWGFWKLRNREPWSMGVIILLVSLSMFSNLVMPAVGIIAERFAFEASFGFCILLGWALFRISKSDLSMSAWPSGNGMFKYSLVIVCLLYSVKTISRNPDWYNAESIYKSDIRHAPKSVKLNSLLASTYATALQENMVGKRQMTELQRKQNMDSAVSYFRKALEIFPDYIAVNNNLGMVYFTYKNNPDSAEYYVQHAIELRPAYLQAHFNMATVYEQRFIREDELLNYLYMMHGYDTVEKSEKASEEVRRLESFLIPRMTPVAQFRRDAFNVIKNFIGNLRYEKFDDQSIRINLNQMASFTCGTMGIQATGQDDFTEKIIRSIRKHVQIRDIKGFPASLDSLVSFYFYPYLDAEVNSWVKSQHIKTGTADLLQALKPYAEYQSWSYEKKAYYHWKKTLEIECTYSNSYEKLKEWHNRKREYDSSIALNKFMLSCDNYRKADILWYLGFAYLAKGDSVEAMKSFEDMIKASQPILSRYQLTASSFSQAGNPVTSGAITNNYLSSASSIKTVLGLMRNYYQRNGRPDDAARIEEEFRKLGPGNGPRGQP